MGREVPLEEEVATHCNTLAWEIPQTEELGGVIVHGVTRIWK